MKHHIPNPTQKVVITVDKNETLARIYENDKVVAKGVALCSPEDTFDFKVGSELALHRALEAMKPKQEWVAVNRKPMVGDYIRIKDDTWLFTFNRTGDILRVSEVDDSYVRVKAKDHPRNEFNCICHGAEYMWNYGYSEFELVEPANATPPQPIFRKIARLPKVGDYVRILKSERDYDSPEYMLPISAVICTDHVIGVEVNPKDHPGIAKMYENNWNAAPNFLHWNYRFNKWEFYEKVDDTVIVYNGKRFRKVDRDVRKGDYIKLAKPFFTFDTTEDFMKVNRVSKEKGKTVPHVRHADNPGSVRDYNWAYDDNHIWHYWDFTGNVYECLDD